MAPRVLIIDDSQSFVAMLCNMMGSIGVEVVGNAKTADEGLELAKTLKPDVITLDIEMPGKTGLQVLPQILKVCDAAVIMCSMLTNLGASSTLNSLEKGAFDYMPKGEFNKSFTSEMLKERIFNAYAFVQSKRKGETAYKPTPSLASLPILYPKAVVIGVSTGGPAALQKLFTSLPVLPVPIILVQHMPAAFITSLAQRISEQTKHNAFVASAGHVLAPGEVCFAPGNMHVLLKRTGTQVICELSEQPSNILHKPSVDVLFQSAAEVFGKELLAVVLTGMGKDGAEGGKTVKQRGGTVIAESQASCIVYGMPKYVIEQRTATYEFNLKDMPAAISRLVNGKYLKNS